MQIFRQNTEESRENDPEVSPQDKISVKKYKIRHNEAQPDQSNQALYDLEPTDKRLKIRLFVFCLCIIFLIVGRFNIPYEPTDVCIDRLQNLFLGVNEFILTNAFWRDTLQIVCSLFMDLMFLATGISWLLRGGSGRLIITVVSFYCLRGVVQALFVSPFPKTGYWWEDPGFPSLVVPYGVGTDFFFSGHIGFVTICALEWKKNGNQLMAMILAAGGVYTGFILLVYKVHYSIDLFTGVTFAHYLFMLIDEYKDKIDGGLIRIYLYVKNYGNSNYAAYKGPQEVEQKLYNNMKN